MDDDDQRAENVNAFEPPEAEDEVTPTGAYRTIPTLAGLAVWIAWLIVVLGVIVYFAG